MAFTNAHFGAGTGTIYLDNVGCTSRETRLIDCSRSSTVSCTSGHTEDAGVRCQSWCRCTKLISVHVSLSPRSIHFQSHPLVTVPTEMFVWWEAPISMKVEWRCASMTSGEQCVMTFGIQLMLLLSASNWDMHTLEVSLVSSNDTN